MPKDETVTRQLNPLVVIIALVILAAFLLLVYNLYAYAATDPPQPVWDKRMALYGSIEAIAFTAAGYLFGKEVHREQAAKAEKRADAKTAEAEQAKTEAADAKAKGQSLKRVIEAKRGSTAEGTYESLGGGAAAGALAQNQLNELARVAESLFP